MAYFNQAMKAEKSAAIKALAKEYGVKLTLAVRNHSTFVCNIKSGSIDFFNSINEDNWRNPQDVKKCGYMDVYKDIDSAFLPGAARDFLKKLNRIMMQGNHDNSDAMTDYFDVGWYVDINVGQWGKPYELTN